MFWKACSAGQPSFRSCHAQHDLKHVYGAHHCCCVKYSTITPQAPIAPPSQASFWIRTQPLMLSFLTAWSTMCDPQHWLPSGWTALLCPRVWAWSTHDCISTIPSNTTIKFTAESTTVALISKGDCDCFEWRAWNGLNRLHSKTKGMILDHGKPKEKPALSHKV